MIPNLPTPDPPPTPYDTKIVANYIQHGLIPSTLDRYFNTLEPQTPQPEDKSLDLGTFKDIAITAREGLKAMRRRSNEHKVSDFLLTHILITDSSSWIPSFKTVLLQEASYWRQQCS